MSTLSPEVSKDSPAPTQSAATPAPSTATAPTPAPATPLEPTTILIPTPEDGYSNQETGLIAGAAGLGGIIAGAATGSAISSHLKTKRKLAKKAKKFEKAQRRQFQQAEDYDDDFFGARRPLVDERHTSPFLMRRASSTLSRTAPQARWQRIRNSFRR